MKVIWTPLARKDLHEAIDFIEFDKPDAALRVATRIYDQVANLAKIPHIGRIGIVPGTRELIFPPWPYIAVYKVAGDTIRVLRLRHASRRWPEI